MDACLKRELIWSALLQALIDGAPGGYQPLSSSIGNLTGNQVRIVPEKNPPCHLRPYHHTLRSTLASNRSR